MNVLFTSNEDLDRSIQKFWEVEEVNTPQKELQSNQIIQNYYENMEYVPADKKYVVNLLWDPQLKPQLANNYGVAFKRMQKILNRLKRDNETFLKYNDVIMDYFNKGFARKVDANDYKCGHHYLPHQAVFKPSSESSAVRVVFDGSSHAFNEYSLNECLDLGTNLNPDILPLLLKFRLHRYAISADISRAFLMVRLKPEEYKYCRYLWVHQDDLNKENPRIEEFEMCVVLFGMKCSTFLLASVIQKHLEKFVDIHPETVEVMQNSFYVDDLVVSVGCKSFATKLIKES